MFTILFSLMVYSSFICAMENNNNRKKPISDISMLQLSSSTVSIKLHNCELNDIRPILNPCAQLIHLEVVSNQEIRLTSEDVPFLNSLKQVIEKTDYNCKIANLLYEAANKNAKGSKTLVHNFAKSPNNSAVTENRKTRSRDVLGRIPLHLAVKNAQSNMIDLFLKDDPESINVPDNQGNAALHLATSKLNYDLMKKLIEHGADIHQKNNAGQTVCDIAEQQMAKFAI